MNLKRWQTFFDPDPTIRIGVMTARNDNELRAIVLFSQPDEQYRSKEEWKFYTQKFLLENSGWITADPAAAFQTYQTEFKEYIETSQAKAFILQK